MSAFAADHAHDAQLIERIAADAFGTATPIEPKAPSIEYGSKGSTGVRDGSVGVARDQRGRDGSVGAAVEEDRTAVRAAALGVTGSLRDPFECLFSNCASAASLRPTGAGFWKYRCSCVDRDRGLAETFGLLAYDAVGLLLREGAVRRLTTKECARWRDRLDWVAGLLPPERGPRSVKVPDGSPPSAVRVARGIGLLVGLRDERWPDDEPFVFARDFARAYCGLTSDQARAGIDALRRAGVIEQVGTSGRAIVWRLADAPPADGNREDALVARIIEAFDAVEVDR